MTDKRDECAGREPRVPIANREQAITWLRQQGLFARPHTGWLGDAIAVSRPMHAGRASLSHQETVLIVPRGPSGWSLARGVHGRRGVSEPFESLAEAAARAVMIFKGAQR